MNWVEIKGDKYELMEGKDKRSLCQIEVACKRV
jgi:DNA polymerase delta subunit 1